MDELNPHKSIEATIACSPRDWSLNRRDAWIHGIVFGWDGSSMDEVAKAHGWNASEVERLKKLHKAWDAHRAVRTSNPMTDHPTWYLMHDGTSVDGRGGGKYIGRTTDKSKALEHFRKTNADPYSIGCVKVVTDSQVFRAFQESDLTDSRLSRVSRKAMTNELGSPSESG